MGWLWLAVIGGVRHLLVHACPWLAVLIPDGVGWLAGPDEFGAQMVPGCPGMIVRDVPWGGYAGWCRGWARAWPGADRVSRHGLCMEMGSRLGWS